MIGSPWALSNKYYNLDDNAVVFYSLFVLLRPGGYGPLCILQELKRVTGWEWLHNTLTEYYYLKYGEEWKTTELSENWNSCGKVNLWWASCTEREREEGSNFCGYLMWHNCGWFSCYHGDGCKGNKDSLGFCEI